jgi:hypothetical protein
LEKTLDSSSCKPTKVVSRIIAVKNKISEIRTKKTIKLNRELSQKVRRGIESIEKSWVINEAKAATPRVRDRLVKDNSREFSPFVQNEKIRGLSPIFSRTMNTSGFFSERSQDDVKDHSQISLSLKSKEEALDHLTQTKLQKTDELSSLILQYKSKLFDLEQERDSFLKIKAKAFTEVKKLKQLEENLKFKESSLSSRSFPSEAEEIIWMDLRQKEKNLEEALEKINSEYKNLHKEKQSISKNNSILQFKSSAICETWNFVKSSLKSLKSLNL